MKVLGVMSGTSIDEIDLAVAEFHRHGDQLTLTPRGHLGHPWDPDLRAALLAALPPGTSDVGTWCRLHADTGRAFAQACRAAIDVLGPVDLVALHGQTLHHWVEDGHVRGTLQIGSPAPVHAATGAPVVHDLRGADIAAGGQGAPLASTLDALWLSDVPTAAVNLGGIANVTVVGGSDGVVCGDTGPANCLLDDAAADLGLRRDDDGALAAAGRVDEHALATLLRDPFYAAPLPKSTGREHFHRRYVHDLLGAAAPTGPDLFATLVELTARTLTDTITRHGPVDRVVLSGGGVHNPTLRRRIAALLDAPVRTSDDLGLPTDAKEAYLLALLGYLSVHGLPGTVSGRAGPVTGADACVVLGSLTPPVPVVDARAPHGSRPPTRLVVATERRPA